MTELKLPFELHKDHKKYTKSKWKTKSKMIFTESEFEYWYNKIIYATHCSLEKCKKPFISSKDRHLDHDHKTGIIRDIICTSCNKKRKDNKIQSNNTSGFKNIIKHYNKECKQGYTWKFQVQINGKRTTIKASVNKEWLIEFAEKWYIENDYYT